MALIIYSHHSLWSQWSWIYSNLTSILIVAQTTIAKVFQTLLPQSSSHMYKENSYLYLTK